MRAKIPASQQDHFYLSMFTNIEHELNRLGITNRYLGWIFLVDSQGRVRWRAHGVARPNELAGMHNAVRQLLEEGERNTIS
jgi:ATPase complex subunit ATP10